MSAYNQVDLSKSSHPARDMFAPRTVEHASACYKYASTMIGTSPPISPVMKYVDSEGGRVHDASFALSLGDSLVEAKAKPTYNGVRQPDTAALAHNRFERSAQ